MSNLPELKSPVTGATINVKSPAEQPAPVTNQQYEVDICTVPAPTYEPVWDTASTWEPLPILTSFKEPVVGKTEWGDTIVPEPGTGAKKADGSKLRIDLVPMKGIMAVAKVMTLGADKYGDNNWRAGFRWSRSYAATMRHLLAWWMGEDLDPESGESHLSHALCNIMFLMEFETTHPELDDRKENNV